MKISIVFSLVVLFCNFAYAQFNPARHPNPGATSPNTLTITATVQSSLSLAWPEGKQATVLAANTSGPQGAQAPPQAIKAENAPPKRLKTGATAAVQAAKVAAGTALSRPSGEKLESAVAYDFSSRPDQFEVREEVKVMDVKVDGKTERLPVTVVTVVPR